MNLRELTGSRLYLDANVWVYARENQGSWGEAARELLAMARRRELQIVTSEWTLAEVLISPIRERDRAAQKGFSEILSPEGSRESNIVLRAVSREILLEASRLTALHPIALPDAVHAATSKRSNCRFLVSNDEELCRALGPQALLLSRLTLEP